MKNVQNDGNIEENAVQNRFTAYLKVSLEHNKIRYINKCRQKLLLEAPYQDYKAVSLLLEEPYEELFADEIGDSRLRQAFDMLREQEKLVLTMHIFQSKSLKLIAAILSLPYPTVKSLYRRSLLKLRKELLRNEY